jgi:D-serine deaminase-like pyridoxal phosphate-dependent protein
MLNPRIVIDMNKVRSNILKMVDKCNINNMRLCPHFKTHQSRVIGRLFRDQGVKGITVSSPEMAEYFAEDGWDDITVAFPFIPGQEEVFCKLSDKVRLSVIKIILMLLVV